MRKILLHYFSAFLGLSIKFREIFLGLDSTLFMKYTFGSDAEAFGGWTLKVRVNFRQESYYGKWNVSLMSVCKVDAKAKRWNRDAKNGKNFGSRKPTQKVSIKNCINIQVYFSLKTRANGRTTAIMGPKWSHSTLKMGRLCNKYCVIVVQE